MTIYQPPMQPMDFVAPAPRKMSVSALISMIAGIVFCIPFSFLIALICGFIGIAATGPNKKSGRWMAVVGIITGLLTLFGWIGFGYFGYQVYKTGMATFNTTAGTFMQNVQDGNLPKVMPALSPTITPAQVEAFAIKTRPLGTFKSATINHWNANSAGGISTADVGGTATFSAAGPVPYHLHLQGTAGVYKIESLEIGNDITLP